MDSNKELLIKDLSCRLPYEVLCDVEMIDNYGYPIPHDEPVHLNGIYLESFKSNICIEGYKVLNIVPHLRRLSSITDEEIKYVQTILGGAIEVRADFIDNIDTEVHTISFLELEAVFEFFNKNHLDYRGLIELNLAKEKL